jgi:hypothetical protein
MKTLLGFLIALTPLTASGQSDPNNAYSRAKGPVEMCGVRGKNVKDLVRRVRNSRALRLSPIESDRFELFQTVQPKYQLLITKPSEAAYPAVSCRHLYAAGGSLRVNRQLRCEAGRAECDALFQELRGLDAAFTRAMQTGS